MHHLYPSLKGDQLCPLGFHPQTRYPTRCKRCFRDYKEHGARRSVDDVAISSPNLSDALNARPSTRSWTSTQNLSSSNGSGGNNDIELRKRPQSWNSTPDVDRVDQRAKSSSYAATSSIRSEENNVDVTVRLPTPPRRHTTSLDLKEKDDSPTERRLSKTDTSPKPSSSPSRNIPDDMVILSTDSLAERVRKMQLLKKRRSLNSKESSRERSIAKKSYDESNSRSETESRPPQGYSDSNENTSNIRSEQKRSSLPPIKNATSSTSTSNATTRPISSPLQTTPKLSDTPTHKMPTATTTNATVPSAENSKQSSSCTRRKESEKQKASQDVAFMLKIKDANYPNKRRAQDNNSMITEAADITMVGNNNDHELLDEIRSLRAELEVMKARAERAERDKSDILLRRLASMDTASNRTAASEALILQQKVNELKDQLDKVNEDKRKLNTRMKDLEKNPKNTEYELHRKLQAAEQLCEELMEENQDVKKEIRNLEAEMDEMHDSFRDNQAEVNTSLQKQLETTTKNCRILSFKLKKCERKLETIEQEKKSTHNEDLSLKVKRLEEEVRFSNDLARKLQIEADELRNPGKKKTPMLGVLGKSTSADAKFTRESLTRGGSQEDPQQLLRDLQDSVERESDLKDQLKFAEEEADNLRKKVARFEDENDSLMMQLKKMATRSRTRKPSPTRRFLAPEVQADRDEGISDEDDPAELRILLELNEQEASILRLKVEDLEKENLDARKKIRELQEKGCSEPVAAKKPSLLSFNTASNASEKQLKILGDELVQLRKTEVEKDRLIERLQAENNAKNAKSFAKPGASSDVSIDVKRQLAMVEQEAAVLRSKISMLESENEKLLKENKRVQLQALRKVSSTEKIDNGELTKLKESLTEVERQRDELTAKMKRILQETEEKLPSRIPKRITDLTPKNHLKRWVEELEGEISEMRAIVMKSGAGKLQSLETENNALEQELQKVKHKLALCESETQKLKSISNSTQKVSELEQKLKKSDDEGKKFSVKIKELEERVKKQDSQIKQIETAKSTIEAQCKRDKDKLGTLEKQYEKERKEREHFEAKSAQLDEDLSATRKAAEKTKTTLEKEIKDLKKSFSSKSDSKQVQELKKQIDEVQTLLQREKDNYANLDSHWEKLSEETILMRAQLTTEKQNLQTELNAAKQKLVELEPLRVEKSELAKKLKETQKKIQELEARDIKSGASEYEKTMLKDKLADKEQEYDRLRRENEMNIDLVFQLRKDNDDLNRKLSDFNRIEQAQFSINGHNASLETEIKALKIKLENSELQLKSEVASTRLRYEQQVKNLSGELTSIQRQCEKFKKDRDTFKQMLALAQKKIADLKANNTGRQSRGSMHSSDDDDKSKIAYLEQQVGCLEDHLVDARLEASKVKTELVSERSANEIKISEMQSKLNELEEERVIGTGRTKIPGMKTKLELSWQKEREDQQRLLQETSTLARDLRQTLFEVERERDKERLESKRRLDQLKRCTEEEMEEGRRKIAELQCDLLELRDVHAKLRTSNEKLRRERERYEKELMKRRMEQDGGERKMGALLHTVDELIKIAPDLKTATVGSAPKSSSGKTLRPDVSNTRRSRSPSPTISDSQITGILARLAETSEDLRKFQRMTEYENERNRIKRGSLRRAASQENDAHDRTSPLVTPSQKNGSKLSTSTSHNGSLIRKSLSLEQTVQQDHNIWRQDDGSISSMQSIDSELGGMVRDSSFDSRLDSRLSGGSTQSDIPRGPRKKKKGLMGKLRSFAKSSRNSESEVSVQGSDSDVSVASDVRASKKDLRGRLSGMFKRSGSTSRSASTERAGSSSSTRPVAVTVVGDPDGPEPREPPPANAVTPKPIRSIAKPPTPTTPLTKRRVVK